MRLFEFADTTPPLETSPMGSVLEKTAKAAGIVGVELAQLLAQCHVETIGFQTLKELPNKWQKHYEPPSKTASMLGNIRPGDGQKFLGRGFIQVTGRYNYNQFAQNSGIDVISRPDLLEKPDTAAQATVDYWLNRVRPNVKDFTNTAAVTKLVNNAKKQVGQRAEAFNQYASKLPQPLKKSNTKAPIPTPAKVPTKTAQGAPQAPTQPQAPVPPQGDNLNALLKLKGLS